MRDGTTVIMVAGDSRGNGTGGYIPALATQGSFPNTSCLNDNSPSSTAGSPAGAIETGESPKNSSSSKHGRLIGSVVGAIVGAVVLAIIALLLMWRWRHKKQKRQMSFLQPVPLQEDEPQMNHHPYQIDPFNIPHSSSFVNGSLEAGSSSQSLPSKRTAPVYLSPEGTSRPPSPHQSTPLINVIQHQDAGPSQTIELPPAYATLRGENPTPRPRMAVSNDKT